MDCAEDTWLTINFYLKSDTKWAKKGHEVAWSQIPSFHGHKLSLGPLLSGPQDGLKVYQSAGRLFLMRSHLRRFLPTIWLEEIFSGQPRPV